VSVTSATERTEATPTTDRPGRRTLRWPGRYVEPVLVVLAFLALFQLAAAQEWFGDGVLPKVTDIASALWDDVKSGVVLEGTWITVRSWAIAMLIVVAVAIPLGLVLGSSRVLYRATHLTVEILRTIPSIAALPFLVLVYGIGTKLVVVLVLLAAVWPLLLQTMAGVHDVDPVARDTAQVYGLSRFRVFTKVVLPSSLPYIATGLRISGTLGLLLAVGTSLFAGGDGLGALIFSAQLNFQNALTFARIFVCGIVGLLVYLLLITIERRMLAWHPAYRKEAR
jgi:ABC-type nitrate/sulfonate/bicarbonate transport system permease component